MHSGMGVPVCVGVCQLCETVVCYALRHRVAVKQGQATPGATWVCPAPQTPTRSTADGHAAKWRESVWGPHGQTHAVNKKKEWKMKTEKVKVKLFKWTPNTASPRFPYLLLFFSYFSSLPPPLWVKTCVKQRSRLQSVCQNILEAGQSVCGWLHLAIACHNAPPAVHHTRPKNKQKKHHHRDVRVCVGGVKPESPTLRWKTA